MTTHLINGQETGEYFDRTLLIACPATAIGTNAIYIVIRMMIPAIRPLTSSYFGIDTVGKFPFYSLQNNNHRKFEYKFNTNLL